MLHILYILQRSGYKNTYSDKCVVFLFKMVLFSAFASQ